MSDSQFRIGVQYEAMMPPNPVCFDVFDGNKWLAFLTYEQVKAALSRYEEMLATRAQR